MSLLVRGALVLAGFCVLRSTSAWEWSKICGNTVKEYSLELSAGFGAPDGFARPLLLVNGQTPGPLLEANQGDIFAVNVVNQLATQVAMHWHGLHQRGTPQYDGVPGVNQYAIPPGGNLTYCFGTQSNYGAYWYHVHIRDIYQDGIRGPILIKPNDTIQRPFTLISNDSNDLKAFQQVENSASVLVLNDWFHETSDELGLRLLATNESMRPLCASSVLFNGMGRVQCPPPAADRNTFGCESMMMMMMSGESSQETASTTTDMNITISTMSSMGPKDMNATSTSATPGSGNSIASMSMASNAPMPMGLADELCANTTAPLYTLSPIGNSSWWMLHLINAGASQQLAFSIDGHDLWVVAADGSYITPHKVKALNIGIGQRYAVLVRKSDQSAMQYTIRASTMTHQIYQGTGLLSYSGMSNVSLSAMSSTPEQWIGIDGALLKNSSVLLDELALAPLIPEKVPDSTMEIRLDVNQSQPTVWVLEAGQPFGSINGQIAPLLFEPRNASGVFSIQSKSVIDVLLQISSDSLDNMAHPIHLHGHYFRVLGSMANSSFPSNMSVTEVATTMSQTPLGMALNLGETAPVRDSAHLPQGGWLALRFVADNPGVWLLHCHINSHLSSGMAVAFIELPDRFPTFSASITTPPQIAPLAKIPELQ